MIVHLDCIHLRGDVPCAPHKAHGVHCDGCDFHRPRTERVLVIKLGAIGDVIRTTPLLRRLRAEGPGVEIWWLTHTPEVVPAAGVDRLLKWTAKDLELIRATPFGRVMNLDKDPEACALVTTLTAERRFGFTLRDGRPHPVSASDTGDESAADAAYQKWLTGLFDDVNRANTRSYPDEIFAICGYEFDGEPYWLDPPAERREWAVPGAGPVVGLNTGCGGRWSSRLWPEESWARLASELIADGNRVLLLGGAAEDEKNRRLALASGAAYLGHFPLPVFLDEMSRCEVVVSAVTMGMHFALGLDCRLVLMNNIFNPHEFELYGRGEIVQPTAGCTCFFQPACTDPRFADPSGATGLGHEQAAAPTDGPVAASCYPSCMPTLTVEQVLDACRRQLRSAR